jgi:hypothetical protein
LSVSRLYTELKRLNLTGAFKAREFQIRQFLS